MEGSSLLPLVMTPRHRCFLVLLILTLAACSSFRSPSATPRYIVTAKPIDIGVRTRLCVAVAALDEHGVWLWGHGSLGCASRSTGPGVFKADQAAVSQRTQSSPIMLGFRLALHSTTRPYVQVRLVVENGEMRAVDSGARVPILRRNSLDLPEGG